MAIKISERFATQCAVVTGNSFDTCGTVTRSSMSHLTPAQIKDLYAPGGLWADFDPWLKTQIEMKACGTRTYGMYEWIMSNTDRGKRGLLNIQKADRSVSLLQPFIFGRQKSVINTDFWTITAGYAKSDYTGTVTGPLTAAQVAASAGDTNDRVIRVINRYGVDLESNWFVDRDTVHIMTKNANGQGEHGQWKVITSQVNSTFTAIDVVVRPENAGSSEPWATAPTAGVLLAGLNNVNDFESWCYNRPTVDPRKRVPFWFNTYRRSRCVDSEYQKVYARLMESNEMFREFGDLPLAERNAQDEMEFKKRWVHSFFFQKPAQGQTLANWQNLPDVLTTTGSILNPGALGGKLVGKKANFIGLFEQWLACNRVRDLSGQSLNWYEWLQANQEIYRARKSQGQKVTDIDWYTDGVTVANMTTGYLSYLKNENLGMLQLTLQLDGHRDDLDLNWTSFRVKFPSNVRINLITHEFFDDYLAENAAVSNAQASMGRMLIAPDWSNIRWVPLASNRRVTNQGELNELARLDPSFACVMEHITQQITLTSETGTVVDECPANSMRIYNFSDQVPVMTGKSLPSYGDLYQFAIGWGAALAGAAMGLAKAAVSLFC